MALEHPGPGFNGVLGQVGEYASILDLEHFVTGYRSCIFDLVESEENRDDWAGFLEWLRAKGYYPTMGWAMKIFEESQGDSHTSFVRFSELLFEYLELKIPNWFIEFNSVEQPSVWRNVKGSRIKDIRIKKHIDLIQRLAHKA